MVVYDDLVKPGALNRDLLHTLYEGAYMDCEQDSDGDSVITESGLKCIATLPGHQDAIHLAILFPLKEAVSLKKKLECANQINDRYIITRAAVTKGGALLLCDYYIFLNGGVSRKAIVLGTKKFIEVTRQAAEEYASDIIA
ncbi:MAG: YbjN domain-containing protein [Alphaproteobacteria bacterium]|nr:YbjN domain-containing protein [Alphaproteobacteria bacterium]